MNAKKYYKLVFKELRKQDIEVLIIDLRDNFGGLAEFADEMLPYLANLPENGWYKKSISWEGKEKVYTIPSRSRYAFKGKIYVFVDEYTYSTAAILARYLKEYGNATVIGIETGTRYEGFAAGSTQVVKLPNSDFSIGIPRYVFVFPDSELQKTTNQGLMPDYIINYTIDDLIDDTDLHWQFLHELLKAG